MSTQSQPAPAAARVARVSAPKRVGILVGRERSFPDALIAEVARRDAGVVAEYATIDLTRVDVPSSYDVLVDRISHDIPCYQPVLKLAALHGTRVVNSSFSRVADDKAWGTALAQKLGVPVPKTFVLPSKSYGADVTEGSLRNLAYPLSWKAMVETLGLPIFLKPHWGGGFKDVYRVTTLDELFRIYDKTAQLTMIAQEAIEWSQYVRCVVIGRREVLTLPWDPRLPHQERYTGAHATMAPLDAAMAARITTHARTLCEALGYDMNTCEFAVRDGVPYAIDFLNSAPDFDITSLGEASFGWVVAKMASLVIQQALAPSPPIYRWDTLARMA